MAAESFLVRALSTLIDDFNRRGLVYALAGGWAYSALVEPRATTDIDLLMLIEQPSREGIQSLLSPQFDSTVVHPAPMVFQGISIWRTVGIRDDPGHVDVGDAHERQGAGLVGDHPDASWTFDGAGHRRPLCPVLIDEGCGLGLVEVAGRLQDQADLEKIRARQKELGVDWDYVERWKIKLDLRG